MTKGKLEIEVTLDEFDDEDIKDYAKELGLHDKELADYDSCDLIEELEYREIELVESDKLKQQLDVVDSKMLDEITLKFINASWEERARIWKMVSELKR